MIGVKFVFFKFHIWIFNCIFSLDFFLFFPDLFAMAGQEAIKEVKAKKSSLISKKNVEEKFRLRGVSIGMIRDATGGEKMDVAELRALLAIFEEAQLGCG